MPKYFLNHLLFNFSLDLLKNPAALSRTLAPDILPFLICAPADTYKRPLTNRKKRIIRKIGACTLAVIYSVIIICLDGILISNLLIAALMIETILISPIMYLLFNEPYRNYKKV